MEYRGYNIEVTKHIPSYVIKHTGKGSLPKSLEGNFTSVGKAQKVIDQWLAKKDLSKE